jgi:sugar phosphate isomerase/epimerase
LSDRQQLVQSATIRFRNPSALVFAFLTIMNLGFVSAIFGDLSFEEVIRFAAESGYDCVEIMCWPEGKSDRRYAGVTHVNADGFTSDDATKAHEILKQYGVSISGLGYYPNPLTGDREEGQTYVDHIKKVITASSMLGVNQMNTFIGRDHSLSVDDNWPRFMEIWPDVVKFAEDQNVRIGIENCPMIFTNDEWPGGKNLATTPAIWRRMFNAIDSPNFGLNYDPSHLVWQFMDYVEPIREFKDKIYHVHAKDVTIDRADLNQVGIMAPPNKWHSPKLPGLGEVDWGSFFSTLTASGFDGPVCVEIEDRAYEGTLEKRKSAARQCYNFLRQYIA